MFDIREFQEFREGFIEGYNYALSCQERENIIRPEKERIDYSNMRDIGYSDGVDYGVFVFDTFQTQVIKPENFVAVIDKYHTQALKRREEFLESKKAVKQI